MKSPIRQILFQKKYNKKTNKELEWKKIRIKVFPLIKSLNLRRKGQKFVIHICFVCDVIFSVEHDLMKWKSLSIKILCYDFMNLRFKHRVTYICPLIKHKWKPDVLEPQSKMIIGTIEYANSSESVEFLRFFLVFNKNSQTFYF